MTRDTSAASSRTKGVTVSVALTKEQVAQIQKATGVTLSTVDVITVAGEAARSISPHLIAGTLAVPCW
jgi:hypothetical protein